MLYFFTCTTSGLQLDAAILAKFLPGKLQIEKIDGRLISGFSLQHISYKTQKQETRIQSLDFAWDPLQLKNGKFAIENFYVDNVVIKVLTSTEQTKSEPPKNLLRWLSIVNIKKFTINNLTVTQDVQHYLKFNSFSLQQTANQQVIFTTSFSGKYKNYPAKGTVNLKLQNDQLQIQKAILTIADSKIIVFGTVGNSWNVQWNVNIPHLNALLPDNSGSIVSSGTINGARITPAINGIARANQLTFGSERISSIRTRINGSLRLNGTFAKSNMDGEINLSQGQIEIAQLGIVLKKINLHLIPVDKTLKLTGSLQLGSGNAQLNGIIDFAHPGFPLILNLQGNNLQVIDTAEYKISAAPDLTLKLVNNDLDLRGKISILNASITPKDFSNTITLSDDVVFVGRAPTTIHTQPFNITMQVNLNLDGKIYLAYRDLKTSLGGNIVISQSPGGTTTAIGQLYAMDGTYKTYGQVLKIQVGKLIFTGGPIINPGLNISTVKTVKTVTTSGTVSSFNNNTGLQPIYNGTELLTVGVNIQGTVDNPSLALFSVPAGMGQADILSYLAFGVPQSQAGSQAPGALFSMLTSMNLGGSGTKFTNTKEGLQQSLGLAELNMESTQIFNPSSGSVVSTTSFVLGKELAPNLYLHYSIGLFYPVSILNLRYQLGKHWAIQSETSTLDNGADILYGIERE